MSIFSVNLITGALGFENLLMPAPKTGALPTMRMKNGKMIVSDKISKLSDYKKNDKKAEEIISLQDVLKGKNT